MELFERDEALTSLAQLRDAAFAGHGSVALVCAPTAVGKSALLEVFSGQVADAGGIALTAVASDAEHMTPLGVFAQFAVGTALPTEVRERVSALLATGAGQFTGRLAEPPPRLSPELTQVADLLCGELVEFSRQCPLALVVDDVHHADAASLACLGYLVRRVCHARIIAVFGHSRQVTGTHRQRKLDVLRQPHSHSLLLRPLTRDAVRLMAAARLGAQSAERVAADCHRVSGGNPLLVGALLNDHQVALHGFENDAATTGLVVGDQYASAVLSCLQRGGVQMLEIAEAIAILGVPDSIGRLLDLDTASVTHALDELNGAGLLDHGRFRHPAARSAVLANLNPQRRAELHRRAAELGYADGLPASVIAQHLCGAGQADAAWAVPVLDEAASHALAEGQVTTGIEYLKVACDLCADGPRRAKLTTMLVRAQWRTNPSVPARYLADLVDATHAGYLVGSDVLVLAKALLWHGRFKDAVGILTRLAASRAKSDPETIAELRTTRLWLRCSFASLLEHVPIDSRVDEKPPEPATTEARRRFDAAATLDTVLTNGPSEQAVEAAERILRGARLDWMGMDTVESALLALIFGEQPRRAAPWCDELIKQARAGQAPARVARLCAIRSEISVRQGDMRGAEQYARACFTIIPAADWGVALGDCLGSLATALTAMGKVDAAADVLNQPVLEAMLYTRFGLHYLRARGRHSLATGDLDGALADFRQCGDLMARWNLDVPGLISWRNDAAEALLLMNERGRARKLIEEQLSRCDRSASPRAHGTALRLLAPLQERQRRPALLRMAADVLQTSADRYELALALTDLSTAYREAGESKRARLVGRQALTIASECAAEPLIRLLAPVSEQAETDPGGAAKLSDAEQRVVDLVVLGHTNRVIAKLLFITVSTVEQHLTRIYRKFKVTCRADLASALSGKAFRA